MLELLIIICIIAVIWWLISALGIPAPVNIIILIVVAIALLSGGMYGHGAGWWKL